MGEKFDWGDLRVSIKDLEQIGHGLAKVTSLQILHIYRSQVEDYRLAALLRPLVKVHHPLVHLDFSHCQIGDEGALALGATILELPNLRTLILTNNRIGARGAKGIAYALAVHTAQEAGSFGLKPHLSERGSNESPNNVPHAGNGYPLLERLPNEYSGHSKWPNGSRTGSHVSPPIRYGPHGNVTSGLSVSTARTLKGCSLTSAHSGLAQTLDTLDLSLNPIGDLGGVFIAAAISRGGGPTIIDMAGCGLENSAGLHLAESLRFTQLVQAMDLSSNPLSESAGFAFVEALYENAHLLRLDLRDSSVSPEDVEKIAKSLKHNWERRRELWDLQRIQERRMYMGPKTGESETFRECSDRSAALASSPRLREARSPAMDSLIGIAADVECAFDNLREEDSVGGGDTAHAPRQICEPDRDLIDDNEIYCRDALDSLVPLNFGDDRCQIPNLRLLPDSADEQIEVAAGDRGTSRLQVTRPTSVTSASQIQSASRSQSRIN